MGELRVGRTPLREKLDLENYTRPQGILVRPRDYISSRKSLYMFLDVFVLSGGHLLVVRERELFVRPNCNF